MQPTNEKKEATDNEISVTVYNTPDVGQILDYMATSLYLYFVLVLNMAPKTIKH